LRALVENKDRVNVLLVDDQPGKLLSYEVMLAELDENLVPVSSAKEALAYLLKCEVAVILVDVCMPELDGFELATITCPCPWYPNCCGQKSGCLPNCFAKPGTCSSSMMSSSAGWPSEPRRWRYPRTACGKANRAAAWPWWPAIWDPGTMI
jgi:hypothetical protein